MINEIDISKFIYTISGEILADSEDSDEICHEVAHKQCDSTYQLEYLEI